MSALALLTELSDRGIRVRPKGEKVGVWPHDALTPSLVDRIRKEKPALIRELEKIRREAGDDWGALASDPKQMRAFYELLIISEMRWHGIVPEHYDSTTTCKQCGLVPIWKGCPPEVNGCPWCFNRIQGLPVPIGQVA